MGRWCCGRIGCDSRAAGTRPCWRVADGCSWLVYVSCRQLASFFERITNIACYDVMFLSMRCVDFLWMLQRRQLAPVLDKPAFHAFLKHFNHT
jgi:hypothetical protein